MPRPPPIPSAGGASVALALAVSPHGVLHLDPLPDAASLVEALAAERIAAAFAHGSARGVLHLATAELATALPPSLSFGRDLGKLFLTRLCGVPDLEAVRAAPTVPPADDDLARLVVAAPPMTGAEYLSVGALGGAWAGLEDEVRSGLSRFSGSVEEYLHQHSPVWNVVGRVCFHLAENKRSETAPFAFLATYATRLDKDARVQHAPLGKAVAEYAGDRGKLLALLGPVQRAAQRSPLVARLVESGEIFHPLAWTPAEAHAFLCDAALLEESGVVVRVPDWWHERKRRRPEVSVSVGQRQPTGVGMAALLDFRVALTLDGNALSPAEARELASGSAGLRLIRGKWVEVDGDKLREALAHWKSVEKTASESGLSFLEGMRLLSGVAKPRAAETDGAVVVEPEWANVTAGPWLEQLLSELTQPLGRGDADADPELRGTLRPYQRDGVAWLRLLTRLGLGACLADDMGLGKTIQVLALLLALKRGGEPGPHLFVMPASLLGNWRAELERFAPSLRPLVAHASVSDVAPGGPPDLAGVDVVLTTYGTVVRTPWLAERAWGVVVLDEAQAIKNPDAKQTRGVKALKSRTRIALTGTPVENRLGDLWSIFDFLCPGLLGSARAFRAFTKALEADPRRGYAPLRTLVRPYILRRMKTDRRVVSDLPDKTELHAFCALSRVQAAHYQSAVDELRATLEDPDVDGIRRRGVVLSYLTRFKQICNHPSQWLGDGAYRPEDSGKFARLSELCEPIVARQEKVLVFTQFREMTAPLGAFLAAIFGRPGLVLHGQTAVKARAALVLDFQRDDGPPFFVLSLKAGGTGLNLTAASHVVHFDRWWNPAVENQATDRAFRIGQKKNVLVHKFVCRGTVEEKVDALIASKRGLSEELLAGGGETLLTELKSEELLRLVSLDLKSALDEG